MPHPVWTTVASGGSTVLGRHPTQPVRLRVHGLSRLARHVPRSIPSAAVPVRAFLFDFDGLILDTETASRAGWELAVPPARARAAARERWALMVGTVDGWDIWGHLEELVGEPLDREHENERRYAHELTLLEVEELRPGIAEYLDAAERLGLKRAIVSSASRALDRHAPRAARAHRRLGRDRHRRLTTPSAPSRGPTLYLEALERARRRRRRGGRVRGLAERRRRREGRRHLRRRRAERVTRDLGLADHADLVVESLADLPPDELIARRG